MTRHKKASTSLEFSANELVPSLQLQASHAHIQHELTRLGEVAAHAPVALHLDVDAPQGWAGQEDAEASDAQNEKRFVGCSPFFLFTAAASRTA